MKFTLQWLQQYLDTEASLEEIVEKLTLIGLEVEEVTDRSADLKEFKIAKILDAKPHPDADKLQVCRVNNGKEELQIVCGAANARKGINVVLAPVGSVIPTNGMKIKASKIRGVESNGMLCSAAELGIGQDSEGIIEMPGNDGDLQKEYADIAGLNDPVIEIAITPNRGDCLGVYGIARDLAAAGIGKLKPYNVDEVIGEYDSPINVKISDNDSCPLFVTRHIKDVKNTESPDWLKSRLESIGVKSISALVDITNYIAYEFGRPLHVYDATKLKGGLQIRNAKDGEVFAALDDKEYKLTEDDCVVADDNGAVALAGVIGGSESGCNEQTKDVVLEVAVFDSIKVANMGRKYGILTDSRYRFERNVDSEFVIVAAHIASKMIVDICGGKASNLVIAGNGIKWGKKVEFDFKKVKTLGGIDIKEKDSKQILESLGFECNGDVISVPSWRSDIEGEADLVEEIVRIYGFDKIPVTYLEKQNINSASVLSGDQKRKSSIRRLLVSRGAYEVVTWSFMNSKQAKKFGFANDNLVLQNPISSDLDVMRPSIIPNLLDATKRNFDKDTESIALTESGRIYEDATIDGQKNVIAILRSGYNEARSIYGTRRNIDAFDIKADVISALDTINVAVDNLQIETNAPDFYHPGRSARLKLGKMVLADFGEIHPGILKAYDIETSVVAAEIYLDNLPPYKDKKTSSRKKLVVSDYQASNRDFAFLVDSHLEIGGLIKAIKSADKQLIVDVTLFDIYAGKNIEEGKKSVAISVTIQADNRTLTDKEIDAVSDKVVAVANKLGGELR